MTSFSFIPIHDQLGARSLKILFPLIETFYLTETENRTKKALTLLS